MIYPSTALYLCILGILSLHRGFAYAASVEAEEKVAAVFRQMESDVLAFADEIERVYADRCDTETLDQCSRSNFNDCTSTYPNQRCMLADEFVVSACGDGSSCNALWDTTTSSVRVPETFWPGDSDVIESICYSRLAEPYMIENYNQGQMYFGSATGSFRIIPARHSEVCGKFDPRRRPWFVAASSGPKDVVLVIDVSGSMDQFRRMELAKEAATTIVDTLTVADRVAVVTFSGDANQLGGSSSLVRATKDNKRMLIDAINGLQSGGGTNFYTAFGTAFDAIDKTIENETTTGCNIAVLFLTDGQISTGPAQDEVIDLVNTRTAQLATYNRKTTIFTFSLGSNADHDVTKAIACSTRGIWTPVPDFSEDLVSSMSSYYKLFALGLGEGGNEGFTAWVEPYEFHTGGKMGTSVSTPVYDHSVNPPLFLGVATLDMFMDDLEEILGEDAASSTMLERFVLLSTARCPKIELTDYELDAMRYLGAGEEATCQDGYTNNNTQFTGILPAECPFVSDLPSNLWHNTDMAGKDYTERACCEVGGVVPSDMCPDETVETSEDPPGVTPVQPGQAQEVPRVADTVSVSSSEESSSSGATAGGVIVGIIIAVVAVGAIAAAVVALVYVRKKRNNRSKAEADMLQNMGSSINNSVIPVPAAASAPPMNPSFVAGDP